MTDIIEVPACVADHPYRLDLERRCVTTWGGSVVPVTEFLDADGNPTDDVDSALFFVVGDCTALISNFILKMH